MATSSSWLSRSAPDFVLPTLNGGRASISELLGQVVVLNFWSAECAWSRRADVALVYRQLRWEAQGVRILGIACNADELESQIRYEVENRQVRYPIAIDFERRVADLYRAETTPHFYLVDRLGIIGYVGALDDATAEAREAKNYYLDRAVTALLEGRQPDPASTPAYGCAIVRKRAR